MATPIKKPTTIYDAYANGARDKNTIGTYRNTSVNGYQNTAGAPQLSQVAQDAQKRNAAEYAAMEAAKARSGAGNILNFDAMKGSFGNQTTTPSTRSSSSTDVNNTTNNTYNTGYSGSSTITPPAAITTPTSTPSTTPTTPTNQVNESSLDDAINKMRAAIAQRYQDMEASARQVSGMNQSSIKGNLGRVFGANVDSSEASPVLDENSRLSTNLGQIANAKNEALSTLDMGVLDRLLQKQKEEQSNLAAQRQQDFNNAIAQAGLTGLYQGAPTVDAQQNQFLRALQEAGVTGVYNGQQTIDAQTQALQNALAQAGITGTYNGQATFPALMQAAGVTGYFNGTPTLGRETANLTNQQKTLNDYLDYIASTTNNQNTNQTKITTTGMTGANKIDVANINNTADLEQLLKRLASSESIAEMNNETKLKQLQINQQRADAYTNRMSQLNSSGGTDALKQSQALTALIQMRKANSDAILIGQDPLFKEEQISALEQAAGMGKN